MGSSESTSLFWVGRRGSTGLRDGNELEYLVGLCGEQLGRFNGLVRAVGCADRAAAGR